MEIGGVSTLSPGTGNILPRENTGKLGSFAVMMEAVLSGTSSVGNSGELQVNEDLQDFIDLAAFLKNTDLLDLEGGGKLLEDMGSNPGNLLEKAFSYFGITDEELQLVIDKWTEKTEGQVDLYGALTAMLANMSNIPAEELAIKLQHSEQSVIKALKLYDLMMSYGKESDDPHSGMIKETLKTLYMSIEAVNRESLQANYLQTRFTRLAADLNLLNSKPTNLNETHGANEISASSKIDGMVFLPHLTRAEQLTLMLNDQGKPVSAEQLMKQFESILAKSQFINSGGTQKLFIKLFPEHLGSIRVELFQKDQVMMARIITSTGAAKETLESQVHGLKQAFAAQSLSVDRIEIFQQPSQQERFLNRDPHQQQHNESQKQQQEEQSEQGNFSLSFEEALLNTEI